MKQLLLMILFLLLVTCAPAPRYHYSQPKAPIRKPPGSVRQKPPPMLIQGVQHTAVFTASFYGNNDGFDGKKAANGEIFDKNGLTAAHKSLPFGTVLKVTFPQTGKSFLTHRQNSAKVAGQGGAFLAGFRIPNF